MAAKFQNGDIIKLKPVYDNREFGCGLVLESYYMHNWTLGYRTWKYKIQPVGQNKTIWIYEHSIYKTGE